MPLLETVCLGLATSIAKTALHQWLKDFAFADAAWGVVVETIGASAGDAFTKRRLKRAEEEIAERVAKNLADLLQRETQESGSDASIELAEIAEETLRAQEISPAFLARLNNDPFQLSVELHQTCQRLPAYPNLTPAKQESLSRLLLYAAQLITDIAKGLPTYQTESLGELLARTADLLRGVDDVLTELRRIRANTSHFHTPDAEFEADYRGAVVRALDELQLFGAELSATSKRFKLSTAYLAVEVEREEALDESAHLNIEIPVCDQPRPDLVNAVVKSSARKLRASNLLSDLNRLIVRGDAGSGKTTLLQWIAVSIAGKRLEGGFQHLNSIVPFLFAYDSLPEKHFLQSSRSQA